MSDPLGKFIWYDLMTTDTAAAATFYERVVGWKSADATMSPDYPYAIFSSGSTMIAGLMATPASAQANSGQPTWLGYISVPDVDEFAQRVTAAGGSILRPPSDIPQVGRFSVVADPHGAFFILIHTETASPAPPPTPALGHIGWHELHAGDRESAFSFYFGLFGWKKVDAVDMGPMGVYQTLATGNESTGMTASAAILTKAPNQALPFWLYYFTVDSIDAASTRLTEAGGQITNGPHEVPGNMWIVHGIDPQGALFALLGPKS